VSDPVTDLLQVTAEWDRAMVLNDADLIGSFMADDWVIVGSDGRSLHKAAFLALIRSRELSHDVMTTEEIEVRVFGDAAVTMSRGVSGGRFRGQPFSESELSSCVFVKQSGRWRCVLTHLSRLSE
jgi:ketosteroid isomerase-like protein